MTAHTITPTERARLRLVEDIESTVYRTLLVHAYGITEAVASEAASAVIDRVIDCLAGQSLYIPRDYCSDIRERAKGIVSEFNGTNHRELALKWQVSMRTVYRIVARERAKARQNGLLPEGVPA